MGVWQIAFIEKLSHIHNENQKVCKQEGYT